MVNQINPIDLDQDRAVGVTLPFSRKGVFGLSYTTLEQAKSNLQNLILTRKGERLFNPEFGTNLYRFIFEANTDNLIKLIKNDIASAVDMWASFIKLNDVVIERGNHNINIQIKFSLKIDQSTTENLNLLIETPS